MKASILFADRDPGLVEAVHRTLTSRGYFVRTCTNGLDCIKHLKEFTPTVLVMDLQVLWGGCDGVLEWLIRDDSYLPPMVVVASDQDGRGLPDRLDTWVDVHISRPKSIQDLLPFINQLETVAWWSQSPDQDASRSKVPASIK